MSYKLYAPQKVFYDNVRQALRTSRRVLAQAPTGFGKTIIATEIARAAVKKKNKVWFIVHRKELMTQTYEAFSDAGLNVDFIAAGMKYRNAPVSICSIQTLTKRLKQAVAKRCFKRP